MSEDSKASFSDEHRSGELPSWTQERQMLIDALERSQRMAEKCRENCLKDKESLEAYHAHTTQVLEKQVNQLKEDNERLRKENQRICSGQEDSDFRKMLLQELERHEFAAQDREADLTQEIKLLKNQLAALHESSLQNKNRIQEEKHYLQEQLEVARGEVKEIEDKHRKALKEVANRLERAKKEVYRKDQELEHVRNEYEAKVKTLSAQKHTGSDAWTNERKEHLAESSKLAARLQRIEENAAGQLIVLQQAKETQESHYSHQLQESDQRVELLEQKLADETHLLQSRLSDQVSRNAVLSDANARLNTINQQLIERLKQAKAQSATNLKRLQAKYEQREATFVKDKQQHLKDLKQFQSLLEQYHTQEAETSPATEALREEVKTLHAKLQQKEQQLSNFRDLYLNAQHAERRTITKTIAAVQKNLQDINRQQNLMLKEEINFTGALRELEQQATEKEKKQAHEYYELCQQHKSLREEFQRYETRLLETEKENDELRLHVMELEENVKSAYINLKSNEEIIDELRNQIQWTVSHGQHPQLQDKIKLLQLENERINAENEELLKSKEELASFYDKELKRAKTLFDQKAYQMEQLMVSSNRSRTSKAKKHLDEITAWQNRQITFSKSIKNLENKIRELNVQTASRAQLAESEHRLEAEEIKLLRTEVSQKEEWVEAQRHRFEEDKLALESEIERLRSTICAYSQTLDSKISLLNEEYDLLKNNRARLVETMNAMQAQLEVLSSHPTGTGSQEDHQRALNAVIAEVNEVNNKEIESLKQQLISELELHTAEAERRTSASSAEIRMLRDIEKALNKHVKAQQEEIDQLTHALTDEKQQHAEDLEILRSELQALRRVNTSRHDLIHNERLALAHEMNRLLGLVQHKEETNSVAEKFEELDKILEDKHVVLVSNGRTESSEEEGEAMLRELQELKSLDEERQRLRAEEKKAIASITHKLQKTIHAIQEDADAQNEQNAKQLEIVNRKLRNLQSEKESLKNQRDTLLQTLSKSRSLSKTDRTAVSRLIDQLKVPVSSKTR